MRGDDRLLGHCDGIGSGLLILKEEIHRLMMGLNATPINHRRIRRSLQLQVNVLETARRRLEAKRVEVRDAYDTRIARARLHNCKIVGG